MANPFNKEQLRTQIVCIDLQSQRMREARRALQGDGDLVLTTLESVLSLIELDEGIVRLEREKDSIGFAYGGAFTS